MYCYNVVVICFWFFFFCFSINVFGDKLLCNNCIFYVLLYIYVIWNSDIKYFFNLINGLVMKVYIFRGLNDGEKNYFFIMKYY